VNGAALIGALLRPKHAEIRYFFLNFAAKTQQKVNERQKRSLLRNNHLPRTKNIFRQQRAGVGG
jgi:hypothetical protein